MRTKVPLDALSKLSARIDSGNLIAESIEIAATTSPIATRHQALALASRIRLCNDPANSWFVRDAVTNSSLITSESSVTNDGHGRLKVTNPERVPFDAIGRLWRCNSKLCPDCLARHARQSRKRLRAALMAQKPQRGERFSFATFTIPNIGLSLLETRSIVNHAWTLFRKRKLCVSLIRGWSKNEEFTLTARGYHYHVHCIFLSKWLSYQEVRRNWTECVESSFKEHDRPFHCNTSDGLLRVVIDVVGKPCLRLGGRIFTLEQTIQEGCKYITKSDSWTKIPSSDLIEIAMIRRFNRMFELGGSFRLATSATVADAEPIVHTRDLSDGGSSADSSYWRDRVTTTSLADYSAELALEFERSVNRRLRQLELRYPGCRVQTYAEILAARAGP